jgi:hypothetical protein
MCPLNLNVVFQLSFLNLNYLSYRQCLRACGLFTALVYCMQVLRVHHYLKMCEVTVLLLQIVKSQRKTISYLKKNQNYNCFVMNLYFWIILGMFFRGNPNWIHHEFAHYLSKCHVYSEVLPPTLDYRLLPSLRN